MDEITPIKTEYGTFYCCDNCGAHADDPNEIKHHATCKPSESKYWQDYYEQAAKEEEEEGGDW
jgi:hypothetical protein